jgi:retinol dehydrogenase-14
LGAITIIVGRDPDRTEAAAARIRADTHNDRVEHFIADLSSQREVKALVDRIRSRYPRLHVLINNAGVFMSRCVMTVDGIERQWAVNQLAYYMIAESLAPLLLASAPSRIVNVASDAHYNGEILFDNLSRGDRYAFGEGSYNQSKLANVLYTYDLARRMQGSGVTANCLHPGIIHTGIGLNNKDLVGGFIRLRNLFLPGPRVGARTSIYLARSPEVETTSGAYFANSKPKKSAPPSYDQNMQQRLREVCAQMTGVPAAQGSAAARA